MHQTAEGEIVGPKMYAALRLVRSRGSYPSRNPLAISVGPNGSQDYGYRIVNRCVKKDLLALDPEHPDAKPQGRGAVVLTEKGGRFLDAHDDAGGEH